MGVRSALAIVILVAGFGSCTSAPAPGKTLADEYYNLGNEWFDLKKFDKAAKAYQTALSWNPELKIAVVNLARTKAELGDVAGALELLAPVAEADPDNLVVGQYRAWLTAKKTGPADAAPLYAALALRVPGDPATQFNAGLSLKAAGRDEEALAAFRAWKFLDGKSWLGLAALAELLEKMEDPNAAEAWLDATTALPESDSKRFDPLTRRAKVLERGELYGDAIQAWEAALALPASPTQARGEAHFRRGRLLLLKIEDYQQGSAALLEAWKNGYKDPEPWQALRTDPTLKFGTRLEADLTLAGVTP